MVEAWFLNYNIFDVEYHVDWLCYYFTINVYSLSVHLTWNNWKKTEKLHVNKNNNKNQGSWKLF